MALTRMTLAQVMARAAHRTAEEEEEFRRRMEATTEEDIRRHMIEDGEDPGEEPQLRARRPAAGRAQETRHDPDGIRRSAAHPGRHLAQLGAGTASSWSPRHEHC